MKTQKMVLAATIAMISATSFAGQIQEGTTGYAARIIDGKEVVIATTYNVGVAPTQSAFTYLDNSQMPDNYAGFFPNSVSKVKIDSKLFFAAKSNENVSLNLLGTKVDMPTSGREVHDNGDVSWISNNGMDQSVITFGADGTIEGMATIGGVRYTISTDANGNTWIVDNTNSGQKTPSLEGDALGLPSVKPGTQISSATQEALTVADDNVTVVAAPPAMCAFPAAPTTANGVYGLQSYALNNLNGCYASTLAYDNYLLAASKAVPLPPTSCIIVSGSTVTLNQGITVAAKTLCAPLVANYNAYKAGKTVATSISVTPPPVMCGMFPCPAPLAPIVPTNTANVLVYVSSTLANPATVVNFVQTTANTAYVNSRINLKVNVVKTIIVPDSYASSDQTDLTALANGSVGFKGMATERTNDKADFVVFIKPYNMNQGICGISFINGAMASTYTKSATYAVVGYGSNGTEYCNNWTFAHELGHSMGMVHDDQHGGADVARGINASVTQIINFRNLAK